VLIQSKNDAIDNALHAQARGASGKYVQEKEYIQRVTCLWPKPVEARFLNRGKKRKKMQKDKKRKKYRMRCFWVEIEKLVDPLVACMPIGIKYCSIRFTPCFLRSASFLLRIKAIRLFFLTLSVRLNC
jgi:hypothetical protein